MRSGFQVIPGSRRGHVQQRARAGLAGPGETLGKATGVELGKDEEIADVQHAGGRIEDLVEVRGGEFEVGSHGVNEPAILAAHVDDQRLAGRAARVDAQGLDVHAVSHQGFGGETSEEVVADTGADGDADAQPGQVHGGVGGSAADVENKLIDRDELTRAGQASDRRREMIDDDHARAGDCG